MNRPWWYEDPPGPPRKVAGGIRARSRRGEIAQTWWSRRFIEVLESFGMGGRLARGRRYARAGQVLGMTLSTSVVVARVQGSRPEPYQVRIAVRAFREAEWRRVEDALAGQAWYAAKLLAGQMPQDIEDVFDRLGLKLFPDSQRELSMDCSCPDWEVPCKHLAATCYLLAESFDSDPFQILAWRGRTRTELLDHLRELRGRGGGETAAGEAGEAPALADCLDTFWTAPHPPPSPAPGAVAAPGALLDQLDPLPLTVRGRPVVDLLRPGYAALAGTDSDAAGTDRADR
ncbi:SWIM zinc finger family protein [Gandjariella thermophila]|uniref:SWIM-type domain-containing protein n=1 Tax=Gandjariella thermophila TaxID=1931992 RepID=A0A4D4J2C5_9PSEU|nr:SWIM zinc finger family protein [Gandjariella thermophila]GDY29564.1 hypothetical protein GTS_11970 [Gandjariella thermophila]